MEIDNSKNLKEAVKALEPELVITEPGLIKRVRLFMTLRLVANVLVFVILAIAIFMWANPLRILFLESGQGRLVRQILLGIGVILLFVDCFLPVARVYKIAESDSNRLKLVLRKPKQ